MSDPRPLLGVAIQPALWLLESEVSAAADEVSGWRDSGPTVRVVRGAKCRSVADLFDEVAAALQFPYYFGENWAAFDECMADMDWLPLGQGIVVVLLDAAQVLADEPAAELEVLVRAIIHASETYARPVDQGEWWDRPAVPFHVVLHAPVGDATAITRRWVEAGAAVTPFPA